MIVLLYVLAYIFVGTFVHWAFDQLAKEFDNDSSLDTGGGFIMITAVWPAAVIMMLIAFAPEILEEKISYRSIHDFYDRIWNNLTP